MSKQKLTISLTELEIGFLRERAAIEDRSISWLVGFFIRREPVTMGPLEFGEYARKRTTQAKAGKK